MFHPRHQKQEKHYFQKPPTIKTKQNKPKCLIKLDVMEIIKSKSIKNETDLLSLASIESTEGLNDIKVFTANNPERVYRELTSKTWNLKQAQKKINHGSESQISRVVISSQISLVRMTVLKHVKQNGMRLQTNF